jgi:uridine monophosphate synthetase
MKSSFIAKLVSAIESNDSLLCVGLDPDVTRIPDNFLPGQPDVERQKAFCVQIIQQTAGEVCCYKPNIAFFEQAGGKGLDALQDIISAVPEHIPVLLDAKRGDIGNTAKAYARAAFDELQADAITVNPYLGVDSITPFLEYPGKMVFLLCHTSNPSADTIQHHGAYPLYKHIAEIGQTWGTRDQVGYVVGATQPAALSSVRHIAPENWILAPGVGAQGGNLEQALAAGLSSNGLGLIVPVSRSILYAANPGVAAAEIKQLINTGRQSGSSITDLESKALVKDLFTAGCIKFGEFLLASGKTSPIYIDLRRVISYPAIFTRVINAYSQKLVNLSYDRLAAVPYAALPLTGALSVRLQRPMIYPRKEVKAYGTAQKIEGDYQPGQVVIPIEDVITTGGSLLSTIQTLERAELVVRDVIVLVDRQQGGKANMETAGYKLHAILTLRFILDTLRENGAIDQKTHARVVNYESL